MNKKILYEEKHSSKWNGVKDLFVFIPFMAIWFIGAFIIYNIEPYQNIVSQEGYSIEKLFVVGIFLVILVGGIIFSLWTIFSSFLAVFSNQPWHVIATDTRLTITTPHRFLGKKIDIAIETICSIRELDGGDYVDWECVMNNGDIIHLNHTTPNPIDFCKLKNHLIKNYPINFLQSTSG